MSTVAIPAPHVFVETPLQSILAGAGDPPTSIEPDDLTLVGTSTKAARSDHQHGIVTEAPGTIEPDDPADEGAAMSFARSDHQHAIATAAPGDIQPDDAADEGMATSFSRSDHQHAIAADVANTIVPDAVPAEGVSTSFARADHTHGIVAAPPGTILPDDTADEGVSTSFARADHRHAIAAATPVDLGLANAEGVSTSFARADHVHRSPLLQTLFAEVSADTSTTSAVFSTLLSIAITTVASTRLIVQTSFAASNSSVVGQSNAFRITVDGVARRGAGNSVGIIGGLQGGSILLVVTGLAAAAHTILLEWRTTGGTLNCRPVAQPDFEHASLIVQEILLP